VLRSDRTASRLVGQYIDRNGHRIRPARPTRGPLRPEGRHHDLDAILAELDRTCFEGTVGDVLVTWGRRPRAVVRARGRARRGRQRGTIKLGSYSELERVVRVHPCLDRAWVPRYFVRYVVFHELLHHVVPSDDGSGGRARLHPPAFLRRERQFSDYARAAAWERRNVERLLRSR
jgi:hypothetical protein